MSKSALRNIARIVDLIGSESERRDDTEAQGPCADRVGIRNKTQRITLVQDRLWPLMNADERGRKRPQTNGISFPPSLAVVCRYLRSSAFIRGSQASSPFTSGSRPAKNGSRKGRKDAQNGTAAAGNR